MDHSGKNRIVEGEITIDDSNIQIGMVPEKAIERVKILEQI